MAADGIMARAPRAWMTNQQRALAFGALLGLDDNPSPSAAPLANEAWTSSARSTRVAILDAHLFEQSVNGMGRSEREQ